MTGTGISPWLAMVACEQSLRGGTRETTQKFQPATPARTVSSRQHPRGRVDGRKRKSPAEWQGFPTRFLNRSGLGQTLCHVFPVDQVVEEVRQVGRALVAEIDAVGMFPYVAAQKRGLAEAERVHAVLGLGDLEAAIGVLHQPAPAGAELARARGGE